MNANKAAGFTLLEILVVITILGVVAALVTPAVGRSLDSARYRIEQNTLANLFARASATAYVKNSEVQVNTSGSSLTVTVNDEPLYQHRFEQIMLEDTSHTANSHGFWVEDSVRYLKRGNDQWQTLVLTETQETVQP